MKSIPQSTGKEPSGVYGIIHTATSSIYIGSATNIVTRWERHRSQLKLNKHGNFYLQRVWNKYGAQAFTWVILEEVIDRAQLFPCEQKWIDYYESANPDKGFNLCPIAGKRTGWKAPHHKPRKKETKHRPPRQDMAKLTNDEVCVIKARLARGDATNIIAREYNVTPGTIFAIKRGKTWSHITDFTPLSGQVIRRVS